MTASSNAQHPTEISTGDTFVELRRVFNAAPALVWAAYTDPAHLARWWGPLGFSLRTSAMDLRPGGIWRFVMIGADGQEYPNLINYVEVLPGQRLRYQHGGGQENEPIQFEVDIKFESLDSTGTRTRVTQRSTFPSAQALEFVVKNFNAIEGGRQHMGRLAEHLDSMQDTSDGNAIEPFVLTRFLEAPVALVWDAWTQPEHLARWMSPAGCDVIAANMDFRAGGEYHYGLRTPGGAEMWGKWKFLEIDPPRRMTYISCFSDAAGGITRHPMSASWPLEMLCTLTLAEYAGRNQGTTMVLTWKPHHAAAVELTTFDGARGGMEQGWAGTMQKLVEYLSAAQPR